MGGVPVLDLAGRLAARKAELAAKWADLIFGSYPEETQKLWKQQKNRFANPVGTTISEAAERLFALLLDWQDAAAVEQALEMLVKIRAVQSFEPSGALGFIFLLKQVLREALLEEISREGLVDELLRLETRIDTLALIAFDQYCKNREQLFALRVQEVKLAQHNLLRRAGMILDASADEAEK